MKSNPEIRQITSASIKGTWGRLALITLVLMLLAFIVSCTEYVAIIVMAFAYFPILFGFKMSILSFVKEGKKPAVFSLFDAFNSTYYLKSIGTQLLISIFSFLWSLLLIVPGIIKSISYSMAPYILAENPEISCTEAINRSMRMMDGHKMQYFKMWLGYFGWFLLSCFTLFIGMLWIVPYYETAFVNFYNEIKPKVDEQIYNEQFV